MGPDRAAEKPERQVIFGNKDPRWSDPILFLLDSALENLPYDDRVNLMTETIATTWQNRETPKLVDGLRKVMIGHKVDYRAKLMELYGRLPGTGVIGSRWIDDEHHQEDVQGDVAPELKLNLLGEILSGWIMELVFTGRRPYTDTHKLTEDAEVCYKFVCDAYQKARHQGRLKEGILPLLKTHLVPEESHPPFSSAQLEPWILRTDTPPEFVSQLLLAQVQLGGAARLRAGLDSLNHSKKPQAVV